MALVEEMEKIIDQRVDQKVRLILQGYRHLKPWVKMDTACENLQKESRWIRDHLCTYEFIEKGLVKKVGGEWHFLNPEFFQYVHDVWWPNHEE